MKSAHSAIPSVSSALISSACKALKFPVDCLELYLKSVASCFCFPKYGKRSERERGDGEVYPSYRMSSSILFPDVNILFLGSCCCLILVSGSDLPPPPSLPVHL